MNAHRRRKSLPGREPVPWPTRQRLDRVALATRIGWTILAALLLGVLYRASTQAF